MTIRSNDGRATRVFLLSLLLPFFIAFPYVRALNNPNELVRVYTVMALVENGTYRLDEQVEQFGWVNDMARLRKQDGADHYYMVKAPGIVYAGVPGYLVFSRVIAPLLGEGYPGPLQPAGSPEEEDAAERRRLWWTKGATWAMRITASQIPCLLFLVWFERYLRAFSRDAVLRCVTVAAVGLGTNYLAYTHIFASHSPYAAVAFLAFALLERARRRPLGDPGGATTIAEAGLAGFLTSTCVALDYQALLPSVIVTLFAAHVFLRQRAGGPRKLVAFLIGGAVHVPHMMWFHQRAYGNPFTPGHKLLETAQFAADHRKGLWGISWPPLDRVVTLATDPGFGFFGMSPFMWLGLLSVPLVFFWPKAGGRREDPISRTHLRVVTLVWFTSMAVVIAVNAGFAEWRAGWTVGPRYLVVCAPFFGFGALVTLEAFAGESALRRSVARGVGAGLTLAGVAAIGTVGLLVDTLPDTIRRPFAQFFVPMMRARLFPHHVGEWFGQGGPAPWLVAGAVTLLVPVALGLARTPGEGRRGAVARVVALVGAFLVGFAPAVTTPSDGSALWVLHPSTAFFAASWEPKADPERPSIEAGAARTAAP